jgi:hypothetical protein
MWVEVGQECLKRMDTAFADIADPVSEQWGRSKLRCPERLLVRTRPQRAATRLAAALWPPIVARCPGLAPGDAFSIATLG